MRRIENHDKFDHYCATRDTDVLPKTADGLAHERLLFHGSLMRASALLEDSEGLDFRHSNGGFYGRGLYLAEAARPSPQPSRARRRQCAPQDACYPLSGRYAFDLPPGPNGEPRKELLVVRACLGTWEEMGTQIRPEQNVPGVRTPGPPSIRYLSVHAGPHRPNVAGPGTSSDASGIFVLYSRIRPRPGGRFLGWG